MKTLEAPSRRESMGSRVDERAIAFLHTDGETSCAKRDVSEGFTGTEMPVHSPVTEPSFYTPAVPVRSHNRHHTVHVQK